MTKNATSGGHLLKKFKSNVKTMTKVEHHNSEIGDLKAVKIHNQMKCLLKLKVLHSCYEHLVKDRKNDQAALL